MAQKSQTVKYSSPYKIMFTTAFALSTIAVVSQAAPAPKLDLTLSAHSQAKIKTLMNDPKIWQQIPKEVTLCVYSPDGANGEAFEQATSYISELPRIAQVAKDFGVDMKITRPSKLQMHIDLSYPKLKKTASTDIKLKVDLLRK